MTKAKQISEVAKSEKQKVTVQQYKHAVVLTKVKTKVSRNYRFYFLVSSESFMKSESIRLTVQAYFQTHKKQLFNKLDKQKNYSKFIEYIEVANKIYHSITDRNDAIQLNHDLVSASNKLIATTKYKDCVKFVVTRK